VRHYKGSEAIATRSCARPSDALEIFGKEKLTSPPGTAYLYSSWGYATLSAVIESAGGAPFDSSVARAVLTPAGMRHTGLPVSDAPLANEVVPYEENGRNFKPARKVNNRCKWGGGAFVSTAEDVAQFGAALLGGRLIQASGVEEMFTPMKTADSKSTDYGMGFGVATDSTGLRRVTHSGSAMGGRSAIVMLPAQRIVVVLLSNVEGDRLVPTAMSIAKAFASTLSRNP
jgi:CubicO group peptidase (beta-lactamase class C family)